MRHCFFLLLFAFLVFTGTRQPVCSPKKALAKTGTVTEDGIRIRTDSTVNSGTLGLLNADEKVYIVKEKFDWYRIILPSHISSYVYSRYLKPLEGTKAEVDASHLNIRSMPALTAPIIGTLKTGDIVSTLGEEGKWMKIDSFPHARGWIHKKFVSVQPGTETNIPHPAFTKPAPEPMSTAASDMYAVTGTLRTLYPFRDCPANCKLKSSDGTFFIHLDDTDAVKSYTGKTVTVRGIRQNHGCSFIEAKSVSLIQ